MGMMASRMCRETSAWYAGWWNCMVKYNWMWMGVQARLRKPLQLLIPKFQRTIYMTGNEDGYLQRQEKRTNDPAGFRDGWMLDRQTAGAAFRLHSTIESKFLGCQKQEWRWVIARMHYRPRLGKSCHDFESLDHFQRHRAQWVMSEQRLFDVPRWPRHGHLRLSLGGPSSQTVSRFG